MTRGDPWRASLTRIRRSAQRWPGLLSVVALRAMAALSLVLLPSAGLSAQAQTTNATVFPDLRSVVLRESEMPGFTADPARTAAQDRSDGSVTYDAVYVRGPGANGPTEVRLAAARTASGKSSAQALGA